MRLISMLALINPTDLPPDFNAMRRIVLEPNRITHDLWAQVELRRHQLAQYTRARFGARSEQLPSQGNLKPSTSPCRRPRKMRAPDAA